MWYIVGVQNPSVMPSRATVSTKSTGSNFGRITEVAPEWNASAGPVMNDGSRKIGRTDRMLSSGPSG
jgi:hypothetical protein